MTTSSAGFSYTYDGDGKRAKKSGAMVYWYGMTSTPLEETNPNGAVQNDYVFFGGERIARLDASGDIFAYFEDHLGSSRKMREIASGATTSTAAYDADFYPFGREHTFTNGSPIYKFEGKIRDTETGLDDFGARYYSFTIGRFMSADWSAVPAPVPYANLTNPQTLNLYAMVSDNPETFADLDGHTAQYDLTPSGTCEGECNGTNAAPGSADNPDVSDDPGDPQEQEEEVKDPKTEAKDNAEFEKELSEAAAALTAKAEGESPRAKFIDNLIKNGGDDPITGDCYVGTKNQPSMGPANRTGNDLNLSSATATSPSGKTTTTVTDPAGSTTYKTAPGKTGGESTMIIRKNPDGSVRWVKQESRTNTRDNKKEPDHVHYKRPIDKQVRP